jgi:hypothetical protein
LQLPLLCPQCHQAVYNLGEEQNIYDTIEFANTAYDAHLSGEIPYIAKVSNPAKVAEVQFWLNPYGESIHLGTVTGSLASGIYTYQWDSTALLNGKPLPDGEYTVEAVPWIALAFNWLRAHMISNLPMNPAAACILP